LDNEQPGDEIGDEDLRAALKEMGVYIDVTESDLKKIFIIARRLARERLSVKVPVGSIMTKVVISVLPDAEILTASRILSENRVSGMPVVDKDNHVLGVISEGDILSAVGMGEHHTFKDIVRRMLGEAVPKSQTISTVENAMSSPAVTAKLETDVREAAAVMNDRRIKRLPVIDQENRLIGIISRADIVRLIGKK
jgi:CBS domain-containing protein